MDEADGKDGGTYLEIRIVDKAPVVPAGKP